MSTNADAYSSQIFKEDAKQDIRWSLISSYSGREEAEVYAYYGCTDRMYCKLFSKGDGWWYKRSDSRNMGYDLPQKLEGVTTIDEAKAVAQVYYFINGGVPFDAMKATQERWEKHHGSM